MSAQYDKMSDDELLAAANQPQPRQSPSAVWQGGGQYRLNPSYPLNDLENLFYEKYQRPLHFVSAYRSPEEQARIRASGVRPAARPGYSLHQYGMAIDVAEQDIPLVNQLPLQDIGLETLARIGDPGHVQILGGLRSPLLRMTREAGVRGASQQDPYAKMSDDELLSLANQGAPAKQKQTPAPTPVGKEPMVGPPAPPGAAQGTALAPGGNQMRQAFDALKEWRNRPLPDAKAKEAAIKDAMAMPEWKRRIAFSAVRMLKGFNPQGLFREQGLDALEDVFQQAEKRASGSEYGKVSQALPWVVGAAGPYELAYGASLGALKNIPGVSKVVEAAGRLPGLLSRGRYIGLPGSELVRGAPGLASKLKGVAARGAAGAAAFPLMDVIKQGKLPTAADAGIGAAAGALLGPGVFEASGMSGPKSPWSPTAPKPTEIPKPHEPPSTAGVVAKDAEQADILDQAMGELAGGGQAPAAESAAAPPAPAAPPTAGMTTFKPGYTPSREPLRPWYPQGKPGPVSPTEEIKLKAINKDISLGIRGVDPGVRSTMVMIDRLRSLA